jgi:transcription elongation factor Elf1
MKNSDFIFNCKKCGHRLFVTSVKKVRNLNEFDCPNCGEEGEMNWIYEGMGNYDKEYGAN